MISRYRNYKRKKVENTLADLKEKVNDIVAIEDIHKHNYAATEMRVLSDEERNLILELNMAYFYLSFESGMDLKIVKYYIRRINKSLEAIK